MRRKLFKFRYPNSDVYHDDVTKKVFRRLTLRHSILSHVECLTKQHDAHRYWEAELKNGKTCKEFKYLSRNTHPKQPEGNHSYGFLPADVRAYNLAVTDLFVEKALTYLSRKARGYERASKVFFIAAIVAVSFAILTAYLTQRNLQIAWDFLPKLTDRPHDNAAMSPENIVNATLTAFRDTTALTTSNVVTATNFEPLFNRAIKGLISLEILRFASVFIRSFTFYGLIIIFSVYCYRMSKALIDQAERIKDRRHSLRQGRMFVHLNGGRLSIKELETAFNWNSNPENAFSHINPDAQAPWGNVVKELMQTLRETAKTSAEVVKASRKGE